MATGGGFETWLQYVDGFKLRHFCGFELLDDERGAACLEQYQRKLVEAAVAQGFGVINEGLHYRASRDWGTLIGYSPQALEEINIRGIEFYRAIAREYHSPETPMQAGINGICLRGKAGWGENAALITVTANSFGARWFDENWKPQFDQPEWKKALDFYVNLVKESGPQGASSNGFNENLAHFQQGKCGMWMDATVAASFVTNPKESVVSDKVGFALAPDTGLGK